MAGEDVPDKAAGDQAAEGGGAEGQGAEGGGAGDQTVTNENQRQAAAVKVSISNYVGTATLAVLAGGVALFTYFQQNFNVSDLFYAFTTGAAVLLVISLFLGGRGASSLADKVAAGTWTGGEPGKIGEFNWQAITALAGTVVLVVAVVLGTTSHRTTSTTKDPCVALVSSELAMPHPDLKQLRNELTLCEAARS